MVEILAAIGLGAKELFSYNRESYKFDQDQRLEREMLRLEMQVKRFELFREDVRDLVELTVGRMDVYHLVGALFLEFCVTFFCEGRVQASAPPFILALFLLSNACAFVYLLIAVWLSMHASIASHSFGVRLLTRFVRLPIPSPQQIASLSRRLADFEKQGLENVLRLPVLHQSNDWTAPQVEVPPKDQPGDGTLQSAPAAPATPGAGSQPVETTHAPPSNGTAETSQAVAAENTAPITENEEAARRDCLGNGEAPFCGEEAMLRPAAMPGLHVQLFRRLQAKWQCYDAYCRVCMALGVNQILQGLTYYAIVHTLVENRSPSCGYALLVIFQAAALAVAVLDISGLRRRALLAVQAVGTLPATLAALAVHSAERNESGVLDPGEIYYTSPAMFFLQACWLELLLWVAQPSKDDAALPRRFRTVLFLDVFGDGVDPTEAEIRPNLPTSNLGCDQELQSAERVAGAEAALSVAAAAVKRWEAAPRVVLSESQASELTRIRVELQIWRRALKGELAWRAAARGMPHEADLMIDDSIRPWGELSPEQEEDPFRGCLLGPFEHDMGYESSTYFYDPEKVTYVWESPGNRLVLSMASAAAAVRGLEAAMRLLLAMSENAAARTEEPVDMPGPGQDDLDSMLRGVFAVPWKLCAWCQSRLTQLRARVSASASGIELSTPLVQRQNSPQSSHQGRVAHQIAGPHAKHFVPERLPWQVLRGVTRILQLSWSFTGMMAVLLELGIYRIDYQQHPGGDRQLSARRLSSDLSLSFEDVQVEWPHGDFFEAEGISWLATEVFAETSGSTSSTSRGGSMMFSSAFTNYLARGDGRNGPLKLQEFADFLPGVVAVNGPGGVRFLASSSQSEAKLFLWPFHEAAACRGDASRAELSLAGRDAAPWRCMAGTFQHCEANQSHWCLLLAGWDGVRALVAEIHVEDMCVLPAGPVRPSYSVPIEVDATPRAFTFIRRQGSLQLLGLFRSSIQAWDLQAKKALWRSRGWSEDFKALSLAEDAGSSELYVVGRGRIGSRLLKARLT